MKNKPLVSIGIATYQHEDFIAECIESVLAQTYDNIEILVCDDGSTDKSKEIILEYAKKHPQIVPILAACNKGIAANYNAIINNSKGEYICIVDGDDLIYPEKIEKQVAFLEANADHAMVFHNQDVYDDASKKVLHTWLDKYTTTRNAAEALFVANWRFKKNLPRTPSGAWLGRSSYMKNGKNDIRTSSYHEFIFVLGMYVKNPDAKWYTLPEVLGLYRIHGHNISRAKSDWLSTAEQVVVSYALAAIKFPILEQQIKSEEAFWFFSQLLYDQVPEEFKSDIRKIFRKKYGLAKTVYLLLCRIYLYWRKKFI